MKYEWDSSLETGYEKIDSQHKKLIEALNNLLDACRSGGSKFELEKTIDFLLTYTVDHFQDEENLQKQYGYPDYLRHRQIHENFKPVAVNLAERLQNEGSTVALLAEVHSSIGNWIVNHIKGEDLIMARYIKSRTDTPLHD
jgi:hemerythrin-like metal-binding domain